MMCFMLLNVSAFSQTRQERIHAARAQLNSLLATYDGGPYQRVGEIIDVDSSIGNSRVSDGNIRDPCGTLKHCYLFLVRTEGESGQYVIGIFKDSQIIWISGRLPGSENYGDYLLGDQGFLATNDLNRGNKVDIVAYFSENGAQPQGENAWVYSWDGSIAECINERDADGATTLESSCSFEIHDVDGDGVSEILGCGGGDTLGVVYSWNGNLYGQWPNSPSLAGKTYTPANNLSTTVSANVRNAGSKLRFSYVLRNAASSRQKLQSFYIYAGVDTVYNIVPPKGWQGGRLTDRPLVDCFTSNESAMLSPGSKPCAFSYSAQGLPIVVSYYAQGPHQPLDMSSNIDPQKYLQHMYNDIITNSFSAKTVGVGNPPVQFVLLDFLDTQISSKNQCTALGWLRNDKSHRKDCDETMNGKDWYKKGDFEQYRRWQPDNDWSFDRDWNIGIIKVLDRRLDKARAELSRKDSVGARRDLAIFVMEVELLNNLSKKLEARGLHPIMTSEAYALLKYNGEYLIDRLPERRPGH